MPILPIDEVYSSYYLRIGAADRAGVLANITGLLAENGISIEALLQKGSASEGNAEVILTHRVQERSINAAITAIEAPKAYRARWCACAWKNSTIKAGHPRLGAGW
jgi:homoserine dehydrogenase